MRSFIQSVLILCLLTSGVPLQDAQTSPLAAISVDSGTELRTIPATLFGTNLEWIWNGDLLWSGDSLDPRYAALITEAGTQLYRFPGGLFADFYDWRNGVGPQSSRPVTASMPGGAVSANTFGTDEALELAQQLNGRLLVTVNAGTGSAQLAADWVRYINASGRSPRVDYWEIGDELYIPATEVGSVGVASMTAQDYSATLIAFAKAMKTVDPAIKIGAILDESFYTSQSSPWTTTVMSLASAYIDFVAIHNAYAPTLVQPSNPDVHTVYEAMLTAPVLIAANLDSLAKRLDMLVPNRAGQIPIAVTEWGAFYQFDPSSPYIDHVKTLGSALYTASALMAFIRSPRTMVANHFKISDPLFMGMIGVRDDVPAATASLYAMEIFTKHTGPRLIATTVTSPLFSTPGAGSVGPMVNVPKLDAIATLSADAKHCFITVVNRDLDAPVLSRIDLGSVTPQGTATAWILSGRAIDANTGTMPPEGYLQSRQAQWARFYLGGPGEVTLSSSALTQVSGSFNYEFPAASVVSLDIPLK